MNDKQPFSRRPLCRGYVRVSTYEQELGTSPDVQRAAIDAYFRYMLAGSHDFAGFYEDVPCSGSVRLLGRPEGRRLLNDMMPGDALVFSRLDRGFRSAADFCITLAECQEHGVGMHLLDIRLDTSTPMGTMVAGIMAHVAQFERAQIRARVQEGTRARREAGLPVGGRTPYGLKVLQKTMHNGRKKLVYAVNETERGLGRRIVHLREVEGLTFRDIVVRLKSEGIVSARTRRPLAFKSVWLYYHKERQVAAAEAADQ